MTASKFKNIEMRLLDLTEGISDNPDEKLVAQIKEVISELDEYLEENPRFLDGWKSKYFALFCINDYKNAIEACDKALRISPRDTEVLSMKCTIYIQMNRYKDCIETCQEILQLNPKDPMALSEWDTAYGLAKDVTLPKPPFSLKKFLIKTIITLIVIIVGFILSYISSK